MKIIRAVLVLALVLGLSGCDSDPRCWFADDYIGCLVITDRAK